jgi:hypothetical protein
MLNQTTLEKQSLLFNEILEMGIPQEVLNKWLKDPKKRSILNYLSTK